MSRPRRRTAFWWTLAVTLVAELALGSPWVQDRFERRGNALTTQLISGLRYPGWALRPVNSLPSTIIEWASPILADIVLAVLVGVVAMLVTAARARISALLAGWGLLLIAAPLVGVARVLAVSPVSHPGRTLYTGLNNAVTDGLWFGAIAGWIIGVILAVVVRTSPELQAASDDTDTTREPSAARQRVRIYTPSQPDWQDTSDIPTVGATPPSAQPQGQPQAAQAQAAQAQATKAQPQAAQAQAQAPPWPTQTQPRQPGQPLQGQPTRTRPARPWGRASDQR